jgi:hypothetical protein
MTSARLGIDRALWLQSVCKSLRFVGEPPLGNHIDKWTTADMIIHPGTQIFLSP